jgi:hypothetical protein
MNLFSAERRFAQMQEQKIQAFYLARAGIEYYSAKGQLPPEEKGSGERRLYLPGCGSSYCQISAKEKGDILFTGAVANLLGKAVLRRTLVLPGGNPEGWYEAKAGESP